MIDTGFPILVSLIIAAAGTGVVVIFRFLDRLDRRVALARVDETPRNTAGGSAYN